ncbi:MAG TPA: energy-coupling factor transporter transmembrane protein EcfT [Corynebacteriales bacterium]|nr:energy-coupling factor transporter transmembrane protein EcfT [Mycobacteriales bacterium]
MSQSVAPSLYTPQGLDEISGKQRDFFSLDPRTTVFFLVVVNVMVLSITNQLVTVIGFIFTVLMLVTARSRKFLIGYVTFFIICHLLYLVVQPAFPNVAVTIFATFGYFLAKYSVALATGVYFVITTNAGEFVAAMKRMRMPDFLVVPIAVMFRFFPAVYEEFWAVVNAMKLRQIYSSGWGAFLHPIKTTEYIIVPLLTSVINIGEDLSASAMVRGLGAPANKTTIVPLGFNAFDAIVALATVAYAVVAILVKVGVI